ncbi:glutathione peroxidase [Rosistilla oblonga]|uniref:glutathione peroxidase n=1 Tax=Rosistilla oblonga TaxID=2527990 RepID=UPI003A979605
MSKISFSMLALSFLLGFAVNTANAHDHLTDFKMESIEGKTVDFAQFKGKAILVVNVASECGLTPQYEGLQALYEKYKDKGLVVLGFPCNQFGKQEPGTSAEIQSFCKSNYDVSFPMFAKVEVNGDDACPLYKHLTAADTKPKGAGKVSWNFEKFLVDGHGHVVGRYGPQTEPDDAALTQQIESLLK